MCLSENEFTFSSMLHTHTHNNEICSSLPSSPPLIRASCGLQIVARLEVCWYCTYGHTGTRHWSSREANSAPLHGSGNGTRSSSDGLIILHDFDFIMFNFVWLLPFFLLVIFTTPFFTIGYLGVFRVAEVDVPCLKYEMKTNTKES